MTPGNRPASVVCASDAHVDAGAMRGRPREEKAKSRGWRWQGGYLISPTGKRRPPANKFPRTIAIDETAPRSRKTKGEAGVPRPEVDNDSAVNVEVTAALDESGKPNLEARLRELDERRARADDADDREITASSAEASEAGARRRVDEPRRGVEDELQRELEEDGPPRAHELHVPEIRPPALIDDGRSFYSLPDWLTRAKEFLPEQGVALIVEGPRWESGSSDAQLVASEIRALRSAVRKLTKKLAGAAPSSMPSSAHLTVEAVAQEVGVVVETIRRWISSGELVAANIGSKEKPKYRVSRRALDAFLAARTSAKHPLAPSVDEEVERIAATIQPPK